jgi:hypothetical protein
MEKIDYDEVFKEEDKEPERVPAPPINRGKEIGEGWIVESWADAYKNGHLTPDFLPNGIRDTGTLESLTCCGEDNCPHCGGDINRGNSFQSMADIIKLSKIYKGGVAVKIN